MTADERFQAKLQFLSDTETKLRRQLSQAERYLMGRIFEEIIDSLTTTSGRVTQAPENFDTLDRMGRVFDQFITSKMIPVTAALAVSLLELPSLSAAYFKAEVGGITAAKVRAAQQASTAYIRSKIGLNADGSLKPGGYLQEITQDRTVSNELRRIMGQAIDAGEDLAGIRRRVRAYLTGTPELDTPEGKPIPKKAGAIERRFDLYAFDTLQEADAATNLRFAREFDLSAARYQGGIIEETRKFCCQRNRNVYTLSEIEQMDTLDWSGKKEGPVEITRGGWNCRHAWRFINTSRALRMRKDLSLQGGVLVAAGNPPLNDDCDERK